MHNAVERFLARLRDSHLDMVHIYMHGGCFELFLILREIWPQAICYYSMMEGHVYTVIDNKVYDIRGKHPKLPKDAFDYKSLEPRRFARAYKWKNNFGDRHDYDE